MFRRLSEYNQRDKERRLRRGRQRQRQRVREREGAERNHHAITVVVAPPYLSAKCVSILFVDLYMVTLKIVEVSEYKPTFDSLKSDGLK